MQTDWLNINIKFQVLNQREHWSS